MERKEKPNRETGARTMGDEGAGPLTRRRLLAGVAGATGIGLLGGAGTSAFLRDTEVVPGSVLGNPYSGANLDLQLRCAGPSGACQPTEDGVSFGFADIEPGDDGSTTVCLESVDASTWLWLRTTPPVDRAVARKLTVSLAFDDGTPLRDASGDLVRDWPLNDFLEAFVDGGSVPGLNGPNGAFAEDEERCLELEWELPNEPALSGQSVGFTLRFAAVQYRAETSPRNPWERQ